LLDSDVNEIVWDDPAGSTAAVPGGVTEPSGSTSGACTASHPFTAAGVYSVQVTVKDNL